MKENDGERGQRAEKETRLNWAEKNELWTKSEINRYGRVWWRVVLYMCCAYMNILDAVDGKTRTRKRKYNGKTTIFFLLLETLIECRINPKPAKKLLHFSISDIWPTIARRVVMLNGHSIEFFKCVLLPATHTHTHTLFCDARREHEREGASMSGRKRKRRKKQFTKKLKWYVWHRVVSFGSATETVTSHKWNFIIFDCRRCRHRRRHRCVQLGRRCSSRIFVFSVLFVRSLRAFHSRICHCRLMLLHFSKRFGRISCDIQYVSIIIILEMTRTMRQSDGRRRNILNGMTNDQIWKWIL